MKTTPCRLDKTGRAYPIMHGETLIRTSAIDYEVVRICRSCRLCGNEGLTCVVPLAEVPIVSPNTGGPNSRYVSFTAPLDNYLCKACGHIQLGHVVPPDLLYSDYLYRTSISLGLAEHFKAQSDAIIESARLQPNDFVIEFGSNDGTLLKCFRDAGMRVQGIDPAKSIAEEATKSGIPTHAGLFDFATADAIVAQNGKARAIIANNVMANIDDLNGVLGAVTATLAPDGVFVFETQYALDVYEKALLDVIYHEHLSYFAVRPVQAWVSAGGLELFDAERIPTKGGSIRFWIQRRGGPHPIRPSVQHLVSQERNAGLHDPAYYDRFRVKVETIKAKLHGLIKDNKGGKIAAYGSSVGCIALIHQFDLQDKLDFLVDDAPLKGWIAGPGYDLPVYNAESVALEKPVLIIILAWRYAENIAAKHPDYRGRFVVPLPDVSIL